jgi:hypothetical protein
MELLSIKNAISFIKYMFQICSLIVMIYQLIKITLNYLSFLINVNLIVKNEDVIDINYFLLEEKCLLANTKF